MALNSKDLGVKCGIEIHQQLDTKEKMFCSCSPSLSDERPIVKLKRYLRPVAGELGEVDPAVIYEFLRNRTFYYNSYKNETCLVECDEEPPHALNQDALDVVLTVCLLLSADIPNEIHVMRKTVTDGSNTSGFQRTAIVGVNGVLKTSKGVVSIPVICLEEEASQIVKRGENEVEYGLDRLGIPLIEIGTGPDIIDSDHAQEVAQKLGMILKSTQKVKRGLGTIRQDINVSIREGARVEIKGFQSLSKIAQVVENEIERQYNLVQISKKLKGKTITSDIVDITSIFKNTQNKIIKRVIENNGVVLASKLSDCVGLLKTKLCAEKTLGSELADYVKAYGVGGYIHTDEDISKYGIDAEFTKTKSVVKATDKDTCLILAEKKDIAQKAFEALLSRIGALSQKVPEETRAGNDDTTSSYIRPLPGSSRLYPETDVAAVYIEKDRLSKLRENLPELIDDKAKRFKAKYKLDDDLIKKLKKSKHLTLFEQLSETYEPKLVATTLVNVLPGLMREGVNISFFTDTHFRAIFDLIDKKKIAKEAVSDILSKWSKNINMTLDEVLDQLKLTTTSEDTLDTFIDSVISQKKDLIEDKGEKALSALMGIVMKAFRGKVSGKKINDLLRQKLAQYLSE